MRSRPKNIYDMSDFRGLLHADFKDTIKCAFSKDKGKSLKMNSSDNQAI